MTLCLRKFRDDSPVVGRRRLDAQHGADEAHVDAAVFQRKAPVLGRANKGALGEAEARGKLVHAQPAQAAVEAGARLLGREALQLLDRRGERVDGVGVLVACALHPCVDVDRLPLRLKFVRPKLDALGDLAAEANVSQDGVIEDEHRP